MEQKWIRVYYLDASALVKILIKEEGSEKVLQYFPSLDSFSTTSLCFAETLGVLKTKYFYRKEITKKEYLNASTELMGYVQENLLHIDEVNITHNEIFEDVENIIYKYNLDVSDAFQIVTIKKSYFSKFECDSKPILVTADECLETVAKKEGLRTWFCLKGTPPSFEA
jgi:predicted nucleic acid-binding protein